jgi:hypothetical protein
MSKAIQQHIINAMRKEDRAALNVKTTEERLHDAEVRGEAWIQRTVEAYCTQLGFEKRTPDNIARGKPLAGWQIHLHAAKKNPILLDLLLLGNDGRYLELELKTPTGKLSPEQERLVFYGAKVCYGAEEAFRIIKEWGLEDGKDQPER